MIINGTSRDLRSLTKAFFARPNKFDRGTPYQGVCRVYLGATVKRQLGSVALRTAKQAFGYAPFDSAQGRAGFDRGTGVPLVI